jgi:hypothetical protein
MHSENPSGGGEVGAATFATRGMFTKLLLEAIDSRSDVLWCSLYHTSSLQERGPGLKVTQQYYY